MNKNLENVTLDVNLEELLLYLSKSLVDDKNSVSVTKDTNEEGAIVFRLEVATNDKGRVIGKQGRIAKAIRVIMRSAANRLNQRVVVEIV